MNNKKNKLNKYMVFSTWGSALMVVSIALFENHRLIKFVLLGLSVTLAMIGVFGLIKQMKNTKMLNKG